MRRYTHGSASSESASAQNSLVRLLLLHLHLHLHLSCHCTYCACCHGRIRSHRAICSNHVDSGGTHTASKKATYSQYKEVFKKWHNKMAKLLSSCLASEEYMHIRNGLVVLLKVSDVFPVTQMVNQLINFLNVSFLLPLASALYELRCGPSQS